MRRGVLIFLISTIVVLGFAVHHVWTLLELLVVDGREDAILRAELPAPNSGAISERPQLIPKIIHQTYINDSIPEHWKGPQQSCIDMHPDYEYKVHNVAVRGREQHANSVPALDRQKVTRVYCCRVRLIRLKFRMCASADLRRYPWFLETFDGYPYPIQRADAIRYFVLHHFGGIYIDLDDVRAHVVLLTNLANSI